MISDPLRLYIVVSLLGTAIFPLIFKPFRSLKDRGAAAARSLGVLLAALLYRGLAALGISPWSPEATGIAILLVMAIFIHHRRELPEIARWLNRNRKLLLLNELAGGFVFLLALLLVSRSPAFTGTEKMMDFSILKTLYGAGFLPPPDLWYAGKSLNYYWFGHFQAALLGHLGSLRPEILYNLMLALLPCLIFQVGIELMYGLGSSPARARLGAGLLCLTGNLVPIYNSILHRGDPGGLWEATRIIPGTITEFPLFSLMIGDLHAHFLLLPAFLLYGLSLITGKNSKKEHRPALFQIFLLNATILAAAMGNPWNLAAMFILFAVSRLWKKKTFLPWWSPLPAGLLVPFLLPRGLGIIFSLVRDPSPLCPFLLVWGQPLAITGLFLLCNRPNGRKFLLMSPLAVFCLLQSAAAALICLLAIAVFSCPEHPTNGRSWKLLTLAALLIIMIPEFIYLRDGYAPPLQRMNTVFKLYYAAWPLWLSAAAGMVFTLARRRKHRPPLLLLTLLLGAGLGGPALAIPKRLTSANHLSFNGLAPLRKQHPGDLEIITRLRRMAAPGTTCLEASGPSYTWAGRVSTFSGHPTVLGWEGHEALWRGDPGKILQRKSDIDTIYEGKLSAEGITTLLKRYDISYVVVGEIELERYGTATLKYLDFFMTPVFAKGHNRIYAVPPGMKTRQ